MPPLRSAEISSVAMRLQEIAARADPEKAPEVVDALERLSNLRDLEQSEQSVIGLLAATRYWYLSQKIPEAMHSGRLALEQARRLTDRPLLRRALTLCAIVQAERGNLPEASKLYSEAAHVAGEIGEAAHIVPVLNNLALLLMSMGQHSDAMRSLKKAIKTPPKAQVAMLRSGIATSYVNMSQCCLALKNYSEGLKAAETAVQLLGEPSSAAECLNRVLAEVSWARLGLEVGNVADAESHYAAAVGVFARVPTPKAQHSISLLRGLIDVHAGQVDVGLERLRSGLSHARENIPSDVMDTLAICVSAFDVAGRADAALTCLHELFSIEKDLRAGLLREQLRLLEPPRNGGEESELQRRLASTAVRLGAELKSKLQHLADTAAGAATAAGHDLRRSFRVAKLAERFARFEMWSDTDVETLKLSAQLADIGMIAIPERLLRKPQLLSVAERRLVEEHTRFGAELLASARLDVLLPCVEVARFHHERWDGSGPFGLEGPSIPLFARVVGLCDTFDAMIHRRPWRPAKAIQFAVREIEANERQKFQLDLAKRFACFIRQEFWLHDDLDAFLSEEASLSSYVCARETISRLLDS